MAQCIGVYLLLLKGWQIIVAFCGVLKQYSFIGFVWVFDSLRGRLRFYMYCMGVRFKVFDWFASYEPPPRNWTFLSTYPVLQKTRGCVLYLLHNLCDVL